MKTLAPTRQVAVVGGADLSEILMTEILAPRSEVAGGADSIVDRRPRPLLPRSGMARGGADSTETSIEDRDSADSIETSRTETIAPSSEVARGRKADGEKPTNVWYFGILVFWYFGILVFEVVWYFVFWYV